MSQEAGSHTLDVDASNWAAGAVLLHEQNGLLRVIGYASKAITGAEKYRRTSHIPILQSVRFVNNCQATTEAAAHPFQDLYTADRTPLTTTGIPEAPESQQRPSSPVPPV